MRREMRKGQETVKIKDVMYWNDISSDIAVFIWVF